MHDQVAVFVDASQALARRVGEHAFQVRHGGV
jgi:hypothetical protein